MPFQHPQPRAALNATPIVRGLAIAMVAMALSSVAVLASGGDAPAEVRSAEPANGGGSAVLSAAAAAPDQTVARPRVATVPSETADDSADASTKSSAAELEIVSHEANSEVFEQRVVFRGIAEPGSVVSSGEAVAEIGPYGHWSLELELQPGANLKTFEVLDPHGDKKRESIIVNYHPPVVSAVSGAVKDASSGTKSETDKSHWDGDKKHDGTVKDGSGVVATEFSANQKYGSCGEDPPYDVFFGTAAPGSLVSVSSPYGSGTVVSDEQGHWKLKVHFPTAPVGTTFEVEVTDGTSVKTFTFAHKL